MTSSKGVSETRIPAWAQGPAELFRHAEDHFHRSTDTDRRLALIGFDNAIEVCIEAFVGLHPRHRRGYQIQRAERDGILQNYHTKIEFLERYIAEHGISLGDVSFDEVVWYHQLRNALYHSGNGMTPEQQHIVEIRDAARAVFRALYGVDVLPPVASPGRRLEPSEPPSDGETGAGLQFLSAYIELEKALGHWAGFGQGHSQVAVLWARFRQEVDWAPEYDPLVKRSSELRNEFVHGRLPPSQDEDLETLTAHVRELSQRVLQASRAAASTPNAGLRGRRLAERMWKLARFLDTERKGTSVLDLLNPLASDGIQVAGRDPARAAYDALKDAQDLFDRNHGAFVWRPRAQDVDGVSGAALRTAVLAICSWINGAPGGRHYYDILRRLSEAGIHVKGPNRGATLNRALSSGTRRGDFERVSAGTYRCRIGRDPSAQ